MAEVRKPKTEAQIAAMKRAQEISVERRLAAKAAAEAAAKAEEEQNKEISDAEIESLSRSGEKKMGRALEADEKIPFTIPCDEGMEHQVWERSFNGLILRFKRGVEYYQPRYIVNYIKSCTDIEIKSQKSVEEYKRGAGKKLG